MKKNIVLLVIVLTVIISLGTGCAIFDGCVLEVRAPFYTYERQF